MSLYSLYFPMKWESKELRIEFCQPYDRFYHGLSIYARYLFIVHLYFEVGAKKDHFLVDSECLFDLGCKPTGWYCDVKTTNPKNSASSKRG